MDKITSLDLGLTQPVQGNSLYLNESLTFACSNFMSNIRRKMKIINKGKDKQNELEYANYGYGRKRISRTIESYDVICVLYTCTHGADLEACCNAQHHPGQQVLTYDAV